MKIKAKRIISLLLTMLIFSTMLIAQPTIAFTATDTTNNKAAKATSCPDGAHAWGKPEYFWVGTTSCMATVTCSTCGSTDFADATIDVQRKEPDCLNPGKITYTAKFAKDYFGTDVQTETLSALNHDYQLKPYYEGMDDIFDKFGGEPTHVSRCTRCNDLKDYEMKDRELCDLSIKKIIKASTTKNTGILRSTCSKCGYYKDEDIAKSNCDHLDYEMQYGAGDVRPTCTEDGHGDKYCKTCQKVVENGTIVSSTGHKKETTPSVPAVPATCEADGKKQGYRCTVCNVIVEQETAPALGHSFVGTKAVPNNDSETHKYECVRFAQCKKYSDENTPCVYTIKETIVPTIYADGKEIYSCECGRSYENKIDKLPAIKGNQKITWLRGSNEKLVVTSDADFEYFQNVVRIDNKELEQDKDYTAKSGSTIIEIEPEYLETLSVGTHTIDIVSSTGTATAEFTIVTEPVANEPAVESTTQQTATTQPTTTPEQASAEESAPTTTESVTETTTEKETTTKKEKANKSKTSPKTGDQALLIAMLMSLFVAAAVVVIAASSQRKKADE